MIVLIDNSFRACMLNYFKQKKNNRFLDHLFNFLPFFFSLFPFFFYFPPSFFFPLVLSRILGQPEPSQLPCLQRPCYRVSKNDLYHVWVKYYIKINSVCNDNSCIVLVMIYTWWFDNIIMMSHFVELWHNIIENWWNPCFDFSAAMKLMHLKCGVKHPDDRSC